MNPSPVIVVPNAILERPSGRRKLRTSPYDCITSCPIPCLENAVTCPTQPSADLDVARCVASPCLVHISRLVSHRKWDTAPPALVSRLLSYSHSERLLISTLVNSDQRVEELSHQETSLGSPAPTLRSVPLLLVIKIFVPLQNSEIALTTARFNVNPSVLAKWEPGEAQIGL